MHRQLDQINRDADRLDSERVRLGVKVEQIVRQQEKVSKASEQAIDRLNADLKAIRTRLEPYVGEKPKPRDSHYAVLKHQYEFKLQERAVLQNAHETAEESIVAAKLHRIPGE